MTAIKRAPVSIKLGDKIFEVEPSFEVIDAIEQHPDPEFGLAAVARRLETRNLRVSDLAWVVTKALLASGHRVAYSEIGDMIMRDRRAIIDASEFTSKLVEAALSPGPDKPLPVTEDDDKGKAGA